MEKTLISWNVPNLITVWLMLAVGFVLLTLATSYGFQVFGKPSNKTAANDAGW